MIKGSEWWFVVMVSFAVAFTLGATVASKYAHRSAIEQSCAHYDGKTGEFTWGLPQ
jgi:H+/Cl- antiporter ClcA